MIFSKAEFFLFVAAIMFFIIALSIETSNLKLQTKWEKFMQQSVPGPIKPIPELKEFNLEPIGVLRVDLFNKKRVEEGNIDNARGGGEQLREI